MAVIRKTIFALIGSALLMLAFAFPAQAYMHADVCMSGLRYTYRYGDNAGDNDVHDFGVYNHLAGWAGFGTAWHYAGRSDVVEVVSVFYTLYPSGGPTAVAYGVCNGSDASHNDWIQWKRL